MNEPLITTGVKLEMDNKTALRVSLVVIAVAILAGVVMHFIKKLLS